MFLDWAADAAEGFERRPCQQMRPQLNGRKTDEPVGVRIRDDDDDDDQLRRRRRRQQQQQQQQRQLQQQQ